MLAVATSIWIAVGVLSVVGLALAAWFLTTYFRSSMKLTQVPIYIWIRTTARILWGARVSGPMPIPRGQGAVIVCNHRSSADPGFIAMTVDRVVHWMVAREYCEHKAFGWFLRAVESIPVGRGGVDTAATKMAIRFAEEGDLVGIFPEGRINTTDELLLPGRPGAALIALKARVPIVPCYISGSPYNGSALGCLFMRAKVRLQVGQPIDISEYYGRESDRAVLEELTQRFMAQIAELAGQPEFRPKLAGRFYKPKPDDD